jgi:FlaA1/EpsC-like NDP-sugar epimerase
MGTTKLLAEKLMIAANDYGARTTLFSCCRFGNVVGTSGSVIPLFKKQIIEDHEITITDPAMTRFIISQDTAINLVSKTMEISEGGEIFVFEMPVIKIGDLADAMIEKYGYAEKVQIGKKPGEKMYEEIMTEEEASRAYKRPGMYIIYPPIKAINYNINGYHQVRWIKNSSQLRALSKQEIIALLEKEGI